MKLRRLLGTIFFSVILAFTGAFAQSEEDVILIAKFNEKVTEQYHSGEYNDARAQARIALYYSIMLLGPEHSETLYSANQLGLILQASGDYDAALSIFTETLDARERTLGAEHPSALVSLQNLGYIYSLLGRYAEAVPMLERSSAAFEAALGPEDPNTLVAFSNLGMAYHSSGDISAALSTYTRVLDIRERTLGLEHESTLSAVNNLGVLYKDSGQHAMAEPLLVRALESREKVLGLGHPQTIQSMSNLGFLYTEMSRTSDALNLLTGALTASEEKLGVDHPSTIVAVNNLAGLQSELGNYAAALSLYMRAVDTSERTIGAESNVTLSYLSNLSFFYAEAGDYSEALVQSKEVYDVSERMYGAEHVDTITRLGVLAQIHRLAGDYEVALSLYSRVLEVQERTLGLEDQRTLASAGNLALIFQEVGDYGSSLNLYLRMLDVSENALGSDHPGTITMLENIGGLYDELGQTIKSWSYRKRALRARERKFGANHLDTLNSVGNMGAFWLSLDEFDRAKPLLMRAFEGYERILGPEHPITISALSNLGSLYNSMGDRDLAFSAYTRSLEVRSRTLGWQHPDTLTSMNNLGYLYGSIGEHSKSVHYYIESAETTRRIWGIERPSFGVYTSNLGRTYIDDLGQPSLGIFYLKQSVNVLQGMRAKMSELDKFTQTSFLEQMLGDYELLQSALIDQGRFSEASLVGRMLKEQEFYEFIRRRAGEEGDPRETVIAFTASESDWARRMDEWRERPNRVAREYNVLFEERSRVLASDAVWSEQDEARLQQASVALNEANAAFNAKLDELGQELTVLASDKNGQMSREIAALNAQAADAYSAALDHDGPRTALLQLLALEDATHLLFITPDAVVHEEVPIKRDELNKMIFAARDTPGIGEPVAAGTADLPEIQSQLGALYDILIKPMKPHLEDAGIEVLLIDAQGAIRYVPFAALHDGKQYLGENYLLALHSAAALTDYGRTAPKFTQASAFGVTLAHDGFDPLPSVGAEIEALVPGVDGVGIVSGLDFLDERFTRISLEGNLGQGEILHVATHYRMNPGNETKSQLLLGDGNFLTPAEIRDSQAFKRLRSVDLVTLSACETALTDQGVGAEVEGIGNVMQRKGANTVIATLWAVSDDSTADFMTTFYTELLREGQTKADALQAAQAKLIKSEDHAAPYYWAPYIIMGNWR